MIGLIRGQVVSAADDTVLVETAAGVGYELYCPLRTVLELQSVTEEVVLWVHTAVSQDDIRLFGFRSAEERSLFRLLIGVNTVGPKVGLALMGRSTPQDLLRALVDGNATALAANPGVGRRTAERLVLELREKASAVRIEGKVTDANPATQASEDAVAVLQDLGWTATDARRGVARALTELGEDSGGPALVGMALRLLDQGAA